jgi:DNA-binding NarL/FixJ family response regulator
MLQQMSTESSAIETVHDLPPEEWASVLLVDDSPMFTFMVSDLIKVSNRYAVQTAANGKAALAQLEQMTPSIVLTDLHMPEMDGIELLHEIKQRYPALPVVIMTSKGSEQTAVNALQAGAASYVAKSNLRRDLPYVLSSVLAAAKLDRRKHQLLQSLCRRESDFVLGNDPEYVPMMVQHLQEEISAMGLCNHSNRTRIGVALEEALLNSIYHGNLGVSSALKEQGGNAFHDMVATRRKQQPYQSRKLFISSRLDTDKATFVIRDEGDGFDVSKLPDPTDPEFLERPSGRGLLLMRAFMDEVIYNEKGNQLTMVKRKDR